MGEREDPDGRGFAAMRDGGDDILSETQRIQDTEWREDVMRSKGVPFERLFCYYMPFVGHR